MIQLLNKIKNELYLKELFIKHEISRKDKDVDILISKSEFAGINFPSNYKLINPSTYNNHCIYVRFDTIDQSFIKIDFIIDGLDYCNVVSLSPGKLRKSSRMISDDIFVLGDEYIYLDRYLGYLFFPWKNKRTFSYLEKNVQPTMFLMSELKHFSVKQEDINDRKKIRSKLIRKKLYNYAVYHIKKKIFKLRQLNRKLIVVIMGIDGAGKTTLIRELEKELSGVFNVRTTYMGWHDFYLWPIRIYRHFKYKHIDKDKTKSITDSVKRIKLFENIIIFIELYSRYLKSILNGNTEIVLFDRYFYDSIIRSKNHSLETLLISLVPKPDLFILLDAPNNVLYERKKEISMEKIKLLKELIYSKNYLKPIIIDTYENDIFTCLKLTNTYIYQSFTKNDSLKKGSNTFLVLKKNKYIVRNNAEAFSLFYSYFLFRPRFRINSMKKIFVIIDRLFLKIFKLVFALRITNLFPSRKCLNENFLIKRIGGGSWPCTIELHKDHERYHIIKTFSDKDSFEKEISFLQKYYFNESSIKFPGYNIIGNNQIRYEFMPAPNLATQIRSGALDFSEMIDLYNKFCTSLDLLYKSQIVLIHGDLTPDNIYYYKNNIHIIDYADSHVFDRDYDKFILLKRLISDYFGIENKELIEKFAMFDISKIESFEMHYRHLLAIKHPST
jgi:thymidylate kinase